MTGKIKDMDKGIPPEKGVFTGVRAKWRPLYAVLKDQAEEEIGPFQVAETAGAILWKHSASFTEIRAKASGLVVAIPSDVVRDEWQPDKTLQTSKNRVVHYFEVTDDRLFPDFATRIAAAWALTKQSGARRKQADSPAFTTIDEYIAAFPEDVQAILTRIRKTILAAAPDATERISWGMPTFWLKENLIHFAAFQKHIGIYPGDLSLIPFEEKLADYTTSKGGIRLPLDQPIPYQLIGEITRYRLEKVAAP